MSSAFSFDVGSTLSGIMGIGTIIATLMIFIFAFAALYLSGILTPKKYTCLIVEPRSNGGAQVFQSRGRFTKNSKFEIFFGPFDKLEVQAPKVSQIGYGNQIWGFSRQRNDITWIDGNSIFFDDKEIRAEPVIDPGMKITVLQTIKEEFERYKEKDKWQQYIPLISIVVAALIIILPVMLGLGQIADKLGVSASSIGAASESLRIAVEALGNQTTSTPIGPTYPGG